MAARVGVDKWLFFTTLLLVVVGLAMVFSASAVVAQERYHSPYTFVGRQALWALAGVLAMLVLMRMDYRRYKSPRFIYPACWRHHAAAGCRLLLSRLAQHPSLDSLRRASSPFSRRRLPSRCWCCFWPGFCTPAGRNARLEAHAAAGHPAGGVHSADREAARPGHGAGDLWRDRLMLLLAGMEWKYLLLGGVSLPPGGRRCSSGALAACSACWCS
jgi:hypothetical protein